MTGCQEDLFLRWEHFLTQKYFLVRWREKTKNDLFRKSVRMVTQSDRWSAPATPSSANPSFDHSLLWKKKWDWLLRRSLIFFFCFVHVETKNVSDRDIQFIFKRLIENYIRLVRYSVLSIAFIADHICLRQRIKQFHASSSESLG